MATLSNTVIKPSGAGAGSSAVTITLVDLSGTRITGYSTTGEVIPRLSIKSNSAGVWSTALVPNTSITPENTYYQVVEKPLGDTFSRSSLIEMPNADTFLPDALVESPVALDSTDWAIAVALDGTTFGRARMNNGEIEFDIPTKWGIEEGTGIPYFEPGGEVTAGEEAICMIDPTTEPPELVWVRIDEVFPT